MIFKRFVKFCNFEPYNSYKRGSYKRKSVMLIGMGYKPGDLGSIHSVNQILDVDLRQVNKHHSLFGKWAHHSPLQTIEKIKKMFTFQNNKFLDTVQFYS